MKNTPKAKRDIYQEVTDKIIAELEKGNLPWVRQWSNVTVAGGMALRNGKTNRPYSGINTILLAMAGYTDPRWFTFKQAKDMGGKVRKGEKGTMVVLFKPIVVKDKTAKDGKKVIPLIRHFFVFNADQIDGLKLDSEKPIPVKKPNGERIEDIEAWVSKVGTRINHGGNSAHYSINLDAVQMPTFAQFKGATNYYNVLFHEMTHWTGSESRCNRKFGLCFGTPDYAKEELVAELGAAFLCQTHGVDGQLVNNAAYLKNWLKKLKDDKRFIFSASSNARKAVEWMTAKAEGNVAPVAASAA